jgi:sec-independent protein translocase protein TatA
MNPVFGFIEGALSPFHILVVLIIGILLFGKRLPEVGRSLGKGIVEFKKGLRGLEDEVEGTAARPSPPVEAPRPPQRIATTAPKFEDDAGTVTSTPPHA